LRFLLKDRKCITESFTYIQRSPGYVVYTIRSLSDPLFDSVWDFTVHVSALHGMSARTSDEKGVCQSVCQTRGLWQNGSPAKELKLTHSATRSLCDSWATCYFRPTFESDSLHHTPRAPAEQLRRWEAFETIDHRGTEGPERGARRRRAEGWRDPGRGAVALLPVWGLPAMLQTKI